LLFSSLGLAASAQQIQVSRTNKTIYVSAEGSASSDPDVVTVNVGYENYAPTQQQAYDDNLRASQRILDALFAAGITKQQIESNSVTVQQMDPDKSWTPEMQRERQFHAGQDWTLHLAAKDAQGIVDLVMRAGANILGNVSWDVSDHIRLQAEASKAALEKARLIADQMAAGLNAKLGELVYASNTSPLRNYFPWSGVLNTSSATLGRAGVTKPSLQLFPEKVTEKTTVYAVFAIQ